ncbi:MAG TPA: class I SAM-dependent methyltransferase [Chthoniobacteraceae bacterium]|jgi:SAM-dependent methyltransferase|nr:class I SAM-dependent methyltransferase [Chthoniobacteraceae bacterium]
MQDRALECPFCGNKPEKEHQALEHMFGLDGAFRYYECSGCGCLRLADSLDAATLSRYYPSGLYYSYKEEGTDPVPERPGCLRGWLVDCRDAYSVFKQGTLGALLSRLKPAAHIERLRPWLSHAPRPSFDLRILDIGCGRGAFLERLLEGGFRHLAGVDPFLPADTALNPKFSISRLQFQDFCEGKYDMIFFNHSLEHMDGQIGALAHAKTLLAPGGVCRVEVPVASCDAWKTYGPDWVGIDAPRHLCLHTSQSMALAARRAGLDIFETDQVGSPFEFWASELYRRGLTLFDHESRRMRDPITVFTGDEMKAFKSQSDRAIRNAAAGCAAFWLKHAHPAGA